MKAISVENTIANLYQGKVTNFIRCLNVDYTSERTETFYDVQLDVKGCKNIYDSFEKYVEEEVLEGENQYFAEGFGKQDAKKGCKFLQFPPVLTLHLKRFEYDPFRDCMTKVNPFFF